LAQRLTKNPESALEVYRQVPDRGVAQRVFRLALLKAYEGKCAFCQLSFEDALDGAHLIPWHKATSEQKLDIRNGLLLCATHHRLFDRGLIAPTPEYEVRFYDPEKTDGEYSRMDCMVSLDLHGSKLHLPTDQSVWPSVELIKKRLQSDDWD